MFVEADPPEIPQIAPSASLSAHSPFTSVQRAKAAITIAVALRRLAQSPRAVIDRKYHLRVSAHLLETRAEP